MRRRQPDHLVFQECKPKHESIHSSREKRMIDRKHQWLNSDRQLQQWLEGKMKGVDGLFWN